MSTSVSTGVFPTRLGELLGERRRELILVCVALGLSFILVSLVGADANDPTLFRPGTGRIGNPCGPVGAHLAHVFRALFGLGAWSLVLLLATTMVALAGRPVGSAGRWLGAGVALVSLLGLVQIVVGPGAIYSAGGWVGVTLADGFSAVAGPVGAGILLAGMMLLGCTALFRLRWGAIASAGMGVVERRGPGVLRGVKVGAVEGGRRAVRGGARTGDLASRGVMWLWRSFADAGRRMWRSMRADSDEDWNLASMSEDFDPSSYGAGDLEDRNRVGDTVVARPDALVEVEWEPTRASDGSPTPAASVRRALPGGGPVARGRPDPLLSLFPAFTHRTAAAPVALPRSRPSVHVPVVVDVAPVVADVAPVTATPSSAVEVRVPAPVVVAPRGAMSPRLSATAGGRDASLPNDSFDATTPTVPGGLGVTVHRAAYLDEAPVKDDGKAVAVSRAFALPRLALLDAVPEQDAGIDEEELRELAAVVEEKLLTFKIGGHVVAVRPGPVVTIFEFEPAAGIKVSRIASLSDDLAMALKALRVRIVAPIPGKGCVGIEIPSARRLTIYLRDVLSSQAFKGENHALPCILGKDVEGVPVVADLAKMPHLLIGGTTGSGKSVGVNGMLMSMLFTRTPDDLRILLIDPKMLEFELYEGIPHLLHPVVTDPKRAAAALAWACREMDQRYEVLARWGTRNIVSFNKKRERETKRWSPATARKYAAKDWADGDALPDAPEKMPYIVIVIDELADLMMVASKEVEESIARIAQKARACGIHLIVATQRPSVDVVTGLIKANLPTRISFQLRTKIDSRTVLDAGGAEALLGKGDMLYLPPGVGNLRRCHGAFVSDEEVARVTDQLRAQAAPQYIDGITADDADGVTVDEDDRDALYEAAVDIVIQAGKASTSMIQRHLKIGYNRAARIIDYMEAMGVVGPADGARAREVLV